MKGTLYGVGVGPGDPELMTLKACRIIRENKIIALPGKEAKETVAYKIAHKAVKEIEDKELISIHMPMTHDRNEIRENHEKGAAIIIDYLRRGDNVVFLTLGDSTVYSTFTYLQKIVMNAGYEAIAVNGITSFCSAASRLNIPLCEWDEPLHIIPAAHINELNLAKKGNYVIMKAGNRLNNVKNSFTDSNYEVNMVENCSMEGEMLVRGIENIPNEASYYSLIIAKEKR